MADPPPSPPPPFTAATRSVRQRCTRARSDARVFARRRDKRACGTAGQTHAAHLSLRRPRNMSSSRATVVFPFRGNCRFSVIYRKPSAPFPPPSPLRRSVPAMTFSDRSRGRSRMKRRTRRGSRCSVRFLDIYAKSRGWVLPKVIARLPTPAWKWQSC